MIEKFSISTGQNNELLVRVLSGLDKDEIFSFFKKVKLPPVSVLFGCNQNFIIDCYKIATTRK